MESWFTGCILQNMYRTVFFLTEIPNKIEDILSIYKHDVNQYCKKFGYV